MSNYVEVIGAYGRSYTTLKAAKEDWATNKDFRSTEGPYVNKTDAERMNLSVNVRYGKNLGNVGTLRK